MHRRKKQSLVEYMLILAAVSLLTTGAINLVGKNTGSKFGLAGNTMDTAVKQSQNELLDQKNQANINSYNNGTLSGVASGSIPSSPSYGGSTGKGGSTSSSSPPTNKMPVASFTWNPTVPQPNQKVTFLNTSTDPDGDRIVSAEWKNKQDKYTPGTYVVELRVADEKGNWSDWAKQTITVQNLPPSKPVITMNPTDNLSATVKIVFTATSEDPNGDTITYTWTNKKDYYAKGTNTVSVVATDQWGLASEAGTLTFVIPDTAPSKPILTCTPAGTKYFDTDVTCVASGSVEPDGDTFTYEYQGLSSTKRYPLGTTTVKVRAVDVKGNASAWTTSDVTITNKPPSAPLINAKMISKTSYYTQVEIEGYGSIDPEGEKVTYEYQGKSADNKYSGNGVQVVNVRAVDAHGGVSAWVPYEFDTSSPLKTMFEKWTNYVITGSSGEWKYDSTKDWIYSTQNVNWTGYYNPQDIVLKNYKLTFDMGVTPANDDDTIGMTFRMSDTKNMYFLALDNRDQNGGAIHSGLYKMTNGSYTRVVNLEPMKWVANTWYHVEITVNGSNIKVSIDGNQVADYTDPTNPYLVGSFGPFTYSQANGAFKNLVLDILP